MMRRILLGLVLAGLAVLAYVGYTRWSANRAMDSGDVFSSPSDTQAGPTGSNRSSEPAAIARSSQSATVASLPQASAPQASAAVQPAQPVPEIVAGFSSPQALAGDTMSPNPPNGMTFSGAGHYQVYRQGNLTYRVDTDNGNICVLLATTGEWRKPRVYRNGCANVSRR